jgi:hypothetical protein
MSTRVITSVAVVGTLVLASCMQDNAKAPVSPTGPSMVVSTTASCSFSTMNNDAKAYFSATSGPSKDQVFDLITTMQNAYKTGATAALAAAAATGPGFQVLGRLGNAVGTTAVKSTATASQGSTFANDVLLCMSVTGYTYPVDFSAALGSTGLFGVRAGTVNTAVISRGDDVNGAPLFGAEPSGSQWHATAPYILFWGYPTTTSTFTDETSGGQAFQLNELPTLSFPKVYTTATPPTLLAGEIKAGVCTMTTGARFVHEHGGNDALLADAGRPNFCDNEPVPTTNVGFRGLMQRVGDWLSPKPLYAFAFGGGSALVGDLSPLGPVTFTPVIVFTQPPTNTTLSATDQFNPDVAVSVTTQKGTPYVGPVTLQVVGNNGSFNITGNTGTTHADGSFVFEALHIDKAGGYTMTIVTDIGTSAPVTFKIQGL